MSTSKAPLYIRPHLLAVLLGIATNLAIAAENLVNGNTIGQSDCPLLERPVITRLSAGVHGAWSCSETARAIKIATCSKYGSRSPATIPCAPVGAKPDGSTLYNFAECAADPTRSVTIAGPKAFVASSTGGAAAATGLDGGCSDDSIAALDHFVE